MNRRPHPNASIPKKEAARMDVVHPKIVVQHHFSVVFTQNMFSKKNRVLRDILVQKRDAPPARCLVLIDFGVKKAFPRLSDAILTYFKSNSDVLHLAQPPKVLPGGEKIKNSLKNIEKIVNLLQKAKICRHSYCMAIGGGAFLDAVGLASALFHRGVRLVRVPTTALAQCDSGVGVKNAINWSGTKNLLGTFAPPWAVLNDSDFLATLPLPLLLDGIAEAIKVAAIKDAAFFRTIARAAPKIRARELPPIQKILKRCALLHLEHIATSGDPFEQGTARPLDYGHWSAHKLEQLTKNRLSHGHAVAIGIALDALYAALNDLLHESDAVRLISLLQACGLPVFDPSLLKKNRKGQLAILDGLEEFRAHLGGELALTLPSPRLGTRTEIHSLNPICIETCIRALAPKKSQ